MLTQPKKCKWCGSIWHSKNKCEKREKQALPDGFLQKRTNTQLSPQNASQSLRTRQKKDSERSPLIREADKRHSAFIRQKGSDGTWQWCYTCGAKIPLDEIQNGHFMSRRFIRTRWDNINCHPQCNDCNVVKSGNLKVYEAKLRAEYGDEIIDNLKQRARFGDKVLRAEIQGVIDKYSQE